MEKLQSQEKKQLIKTNSEILESMDHGFIICILNMFKIDIMNKQWTIKTKEYDAYYITKIKIYGI